MIARTTSDKTRTKKGSREKGSVIRSAPKDNQHVGENSRGSNGGKEKLETKGGARGAHTVEKTLREGNGRLGDKTKGQNNPRKEHIHETPRGVHDSMKIHVHGLTDIGAKKGESPNAPIKTPGVKKSAPSNPNHLLLKENPTTLPSRSTGGGNLYGSIPPRTNTTIHAQTTPSRLEETRVTYDNRSRETATKYHSLCHYREHTDTVQPSQAKR